MRKVTTSGWRIVKREAGAWLYPLWVRLDASLGSHPLIGSQEF